MTIRIFAGALSAALLFGALGGPASADDIADAIAEAAKAYQSGELATSRQSLELAAQLIAQKQTEALAKLLPEPPSGWTAEAPDTSAGTAAFLGGGLIVKRSYASGDKTIELQLTANSPLLGSMAPLFSNIQLLGGMGKVFRQKGRAAVMTDSAEIQLVAGQTFLTMSGSAPEADKRALLDLVDLGAVEAFGK